MNLSCVFSICMTHEACPDRFATVVRPITVGTVPTCSPLQGESADLWRTNVYIWKHAPPECDKILILESDARPTPLFFKRLSGLPNRDIVWLDDRTEASLHSPSGCCTIGMLYTRSILGLLIKEFESKDASSYAMRYSPRPINPSNVCLFDWFLGNLASYKRIKSAVVHLLHHK
jgi:hypothetical protein